jgi:hypothetical protein
MSWKWIFPFIERLKRILPGTVSVLPVILVATTPTIDDAFNLQRAFIPPGHQDNVELYLDANQVVVGMQFSGTFDPNEIDLIEFTWPETLLHMNEGQGPDFAPYHIDHQAGTFAGAVIFETLIPFTGENIPPGYDIHILNAVVAVDHLVLEGTTLDGLHLENGHPACPTCPPINNIYITPPGFSVQPALNDASIVAAVAFIRGDVDYNGSLPNLVDALYLLAYQFVQGSPAPPCPDSADVDDNGFVNGLVDGLYLLNFSFASGSPPPGPYPDPGIDMTPDGLGECPPL